MVKQVIPALPRKDCSGVDAHPADQEGLHTNAVDHKESALEQTAGRDGGTMLEQSFPA